MPDLELLIQEYVPIKKQYLIRELQEENEILKEKISEAINGIEITISIIKQQPSKDDGLDFYIISKLESFVKTLKGTNNE